MGAPPTSTDSTPAPAGTDATRNARYVYLVGRIRNRQMTMEEATELFGLMQGMLRTSELARQAALRAMSAQPAPPTTTAPKPAAGPAPPAGALSADELLMLGILGTGAASGVLAALTKRIQELMASAPAPAQSDARSP